MFGKGEKMILKRAFRHWTALVLIGCAPVGATAATPPSAPYSFTIDESASSITVQIAALTLSDSDTSAIGGSAAVVLTPALADFTEIHIVDLQAALTETLTFNLSGGLLGGIDATGVDLAVAMGSSATAVGSPAPVDALGAFVQLDNAFVGSGTVSYAGYGIVGASVGSGTISLADLGELPADLPGVVYVSGDVIVLETDLDASGSYTDPDSGVTVDVTVSGQIVATAPLPGFADIDADADVDAFDASIFFASMRGPDVPPALAGGYPPSNTLAGFDGDVDGDLDLHDYAAVQAAADA